MEAWLISLHKGWVDELDRRLPSFVSSCLKEKKKERKLDRKGEDEKGVW